MPSWSALPMEMRGEIVKRLDFRTRFRFRHVSKTDKELVDSVPLFIPRVVFFAKSTTEARLTFWLGIEKRIDVGFVNCGGAKTCAIVFEVSLSKTIHVATRQVDSPSALMLALSAFKHVAMSPNTLSGAIELINPHHSELENAEARALIGDGKIRTKIVFMTPDVNKLFMSRVVRSEVEEIRIVCQVEEKVRLATYTRRLRARVDEEELIKCPDDCSWMQLYVLPRDVSRYIRAQLKKYRISPASRMKKVGVDDFFVYTKGDQSTTYERINSCGLATWIPAFDVEIESPTNCWMRWACPTHADPFDHWYHTRHSPIGTQSDLAKGLLSEIVFPVLNGNCQLEGLLDEWVDKLRREEHKKNDKKWRLLMAFALFSVVTGIIVQWVIFA